MEFGTRRAQEMDAAIWGTRAAVIGGANGTSNVRAGKLFDIPVLGTHAHALVQVYGNDYEAFKAYAATHKNRIAILKRLLAEINLKDRLFIVNPLVKVNLHHVNLVQVRVQCQTIIWIHLFSFFLLYKGMNVFCHFHTIR